MLQSHHQNAGENHDIKTANISFENTAVQIFESGSNKSKSGSDYARL
jgi:hypothetical protein